MKSSIITLLCLLIGFSVNAQNDCDEATITSVSGQGTYCDGDSVILSVDGTLNNAEEWTWYSSRCGGQEVGSGSSITVTVEESVTYFVRGTGGCVGNSGSCTSLEVKLDDIAPEVTSKPDDIVTDNDPGLCSAVVDFVTPEAEDNCSDEITVEQTDGPESGSAFPVGITDVKYTITDELGNSVAVEFTVTVLDSEAPVISCPADIEADNDPGECGAIVTYEAPTGTDNCPGVVTELTEGLGSGSFFPVGTTVETYTTTDAAGNESTCSVSVTVYDVEPPVITLHEKPITLWPPNHKPHELSIEDQIKEVSDNCGGVTIEDVVVEMVSSDEEQNGSGDGNTESDIVVSDDCKSMMLLAERSGNGNGRVYQVSLALMDLHGNVGRASYLATVPHDKGKNTQTIDDGPKYTVEACILEKDSIDDPDLVGPVQSRVQLDFETFPNPFVNSLLLRFKAQKSEPLKVELYSRNGQKIATLKESEVISTNEYNWKFDLSAYDTDLFFIVIWGEGTYGIKRIYHK